MYIIAKIKLTKEASEAIKNGGDIADIKVYLGEPTTNNIRDVDVCYSYAITEITDS